MPVLAASPIQVSRFSCRACLCWYHTKKATTMSKDPTFPFYSQDFLVGTFGMEDAAVGRYIRLLALQHQTGHLPEKTVLKICGGEMDPEVLNKFKIDDQGNYYNERLDEVIEEKVKFKAKQRENIDKRWGKKDTNDIPGEYQTDTKSIPESYQTDTKPIPLEDEDESEDEERRREGNPNPNKVAGKKEKEYPEEVLNTYTLALPFFDKEYHPRTPSTQGKWLDTIDKLIRIDKRTPEQILDVIAKTRADAFWRLNFRSIIKLRDKNKEDIPYLVVFEKRFNQEKPLTNAEKTLKELEVKYANF